MAPPERGRGEQPGAGEGEGAPPPSPAPICLVAVGPSEVPGGGEGLVASRAVGAGEVLLRELPIARFEARPLEGNGDWHLLSEALGKLEESGGLSALVESAVGRALWRGPSTDDARRDAFRRCIDETWPDGAEAERAARAEALNVLSYNAYVSPDGGRLQIVYPTISKANHACCPSCDVLAQEVGPGEVVTSVPIAEGAEVTVSYLASGDLLLPRARRLSLLRDGWAFACRCPRCLAPGDDARRFACARPGCGGGCCALDGAAGPAIAADGVRESEGVALAACEACGHTASESEARALLEAEGEVAELLRGLPDSMFSAWSVCDDFALAHPGHGASGRWKRYLASYTEQEARSSDDPEEAKELLAEAARHREAWQRCLDAVLKETTVGPP